MIVIGIRRLMPDNRHKTAHVVMYSGGVGSYMAAKRVVEKHGSENTILLFADTKIEDETLYGFLEKSSEKLGVKLIKLQEGRDPWQVFFDVKFLGNSRVDPCSKILKRDYLKKYLKNNFDPNNTVVYFGIDWSEKHRLKNAEGNNAPFKCEAPMCEPPYLSKEDMLIELAEDGIAVPDLYLEGFSHNNCGGFCIKAGQAHFKNLLIKKPETYRYHEEKEQEIREYLGKNVSILKDRRGGTTKPLTLKDFRERLEEDEDLYDKNEWGGCGCAI